MRSQLPNINPSIDSSKASKPLPSNADDSYVLPHEIIHPEIAHHSTLQTLGRLACTSLKIKALVENGDQVWRQLVERDLTQAPQIKDGESYRSYYMRKQIRMWHYLKLNYTKYNIGLKYGWEQVVRANLPEANKRGYYELRNRINWSGGQHRMSQYLFDEARMLLQPLYPPLQLPTDPYAPVAAQALAYWAALPHLKRVKTLMPSDHMLYTNVLPFFTMDDLLVDAQFEMFGFKSHELIKRIILLRYAQVTDESGFKKIFEKIPAAEQPTCLLELLLMSLSKDDFDIPASTFRLKNALRLLFNFLDQETRGQLITDLRVLMERMFQQNRDVCLLEFSILTPFLRSVNLGRWQLQVLNIPAVWFLVQLCQKQKIPAFNFDLQKLLKFYEKNSSALSGLVMMAEIDQPDVKSVLTDGAVARDVFKRMLLDGCSYNEIRKLLTHIVDRESFIKTLLDDFFTTILFRNIPSRPVFQCVSLDILFIKNLNKFFLIDRTFYAIFRKILFDSVSSLDEYEKEYVFKSIGLIKALYAEQLEEHSARSLHEASNGDAASKAVSVVALGLFATRTTAQPAILHRTSHNHIDPPFALL